MAAAVDLDGIAHGLEGVEGKADGEDNFKEGEDPIPASLEEEVVDVIDKEVIVFEEGQDSDVGYDAHHEVPLSSGAGRIFDQDACKIVDNYSEDEDKDIDRDEVHVKDAACDQQVQPTPAMGDDEIDQRDQGEEDQKLKGVEEHMPGLSIA
jgi:hypothetical protein